MEDVAIIPAPVQWDGLASKLDRVFVRTMGLFIFLTIFLPGGSVYGLNFKSPLYLILIPLALHSLFWRGLTSSLRLALMFGLPAVFSFWIVLGVLHGFSAATSLRQFTDVMMTFLMCWLAFVFCGNGNSGRLQFARLVLYTEVATSVFKVGLLVYALARGIPTVQIISIVSRVFGVDLMTMDLGALFGRVQFVSDALIPVCVFLILRYRSQLKISPFRASLMIVLLLTSVVFGFSRYFWGFTAIAFVTGLILAKRDKFLLIVAAVLGASILVSLPALTALYGLRFSNEVAGSSDDVRSEQTVALKKFFWEAPLLGHGFGSYTNAVIRQEDGNTNLNYSYEEQLLALSAQIGVLGIAFLIAIGAFYYSRLWRQPVLRLPDRFGIAALLLFWVAAGLYNPLLFHPIAGINFAMLAAMTSLRLESDTESQEPAG